MFHIKYKDGGEYASLDLSWERPRLQLLIPFLNLQKREE